MSGPIYLDYCATTPVHPQVRDAVLPLLNEQYGNPSSMHKIGMQANILLTEARSAVAEGLGCSKEEIYFTSGATEADNLALFGVMRQFEPGKAHLVTTEIEHHAILHAAQQLEREGYQVSYLPVDSRGIVDPQDLVKLIRPETKLVSVMMVNNEVGSIQPLQKIGAITSQHGILLHTDAVQGVGLLDLDLAAWHIDLLSLSAHKIYGLKGVGALFIREGVPVLPCIYGGPQEKTIRPGTENLPGIVSLAEAVKVVGSEKQKERKRLSELRSWFIEGLRNRIEGVIINTPLQSSPHVLSVSFPGASAEMMQVRLSRDNIAVSLGSACNSKEVAPSHVLVAMGLSHGQIEGTIRISFGYPTTQEELENFLELIPTIWRRSKFTDD